MGEKMPLPVQKIVKNQILETGAKSVVKVGSL